MVGTTLRVMEEAREERGLRKAECGGKTNVLCLNKYVQHHQTKQVALRSQEPTEQRKQHTIDSHNLYPTSIPQA